VKFHRASGFAVPDRGRGFFLTLAGVNACVHGTRFWEVDVEVEVEVGINRGGGWKGIGYVLVAAFRKYKYKRSRV